MWTMFGIFNAGRHDKHFLKILHKCGSECGVAALQYAECYGSNVHRVCHLQALVHKNTLPLENISNHTKHLNYMATTGSVFRES